MLARTAAKVSTSKILGIRRPNEEGYGISAYPYEDSFKGEAIDVLLLIVPFEILCNLDSPANLLKQYISSTRSSVLFF
jgi:hypothetical protein